MIKKLLTATAIALFSASAFSAGGPAIPLDSMKPDMKDTVSLQNGLRTYMDNCAGCHSLGYARYNRVARDLQIPEETMMQYVIFEQNARFGDLMEFSMSLKDGKEWFGAPPLDLTLVTRVRGVDWVYTYLRSFYKDDSRPYGVNNAVFKDVGMPHVLIQQQGLCATKPVIGEGERIDPLTGSKLNHENCSSFETAGSLTSAGFDELVYDLVNFLNYMGEPYQEDRKRIGWMVFAFLTVLLVFTTLLQRELYKDLKR